MSGVDNQILNRITKSKIIAVEGQDEINFFKSYLNFLKINLNDIDLIEVKGKDKFKNQIESLVKRSGFSQVTSLAIIRDSDLDAESAFRSITNILSKNRLTPPAKMNSFSTGHPKIGVFIMPDNENKGALEDLCLKTVISDKIFACLESFFKCINKENNKEETNYLKKDFSKRKAQVFLATRKELVNSVGLGAIKNYWNFDSTELNSLKNFLSELV